MAQATLYPSSISQPNAHDRNPITKWCFKEVRRGGGVYSYGCSSPKDPRYFHEWSNVDELKTGGTAQCGRPAKRSCTHKVEHGIAGYRNTCPIAGCNGTYNAPATLRLHLSSKALSDKGIKSGAKVNSVTISFQHSCRGVDVGNGHESTNWGPNFYGYKQYPSLKVLKLFFTNSNGTRISKIISTDSNGKDFSNPPLTSYGTVTATFDDVSYDEIKGGALNIVYGRNLSTNPGNIYIKNAKIQIDYSDAQASIVGKTDRNTLLTSDESKCCSSIYNTITAGYKQNNKWKTSGAPKTYTKDDISISKPQNVSVDFVSQSGINIKYKITDYSNVEGYKKITYQIKGTSKKITLGYTAKKNPKPTVKIDSAFKQYLKLEDISATSLVFKDGCTNDIKIYADSLSNRIAQITETNICHTCSNNIVNEATIKNVIKSISELSCGPHTLYFQRNNEPTASIIKKSISIVPRNYTFKMFVTTENQQEFDFVQDKDDYQKIIKIQRTDNENPSIVPRFKITENTLLRHRIPNSSETAAFELASNATKDVPISVYLPGIFSISIQEVNNINAQCSLAKDTRTINITPNHQQSHDVLFVRGEDSTSFDYDYLVAWEGDDIKQPIGVDDIELISSYNDIKVCADEFSTAGLSQTGVAHIRVINQSAQELDLKNIKIELNFLTQNEDGELEVTTDEFFELNGMLLNLENNFKMYNKDLSDNISLENLSPDADLEEEENVYINIKELKYGDNVIINIPFECKSPRDIYCQPLIFGEPIELHSFFDCSSEPFEYMHINTYDSILTDMQIIGETDILTPNIGYNILTGESENQCPNECFNTKADQTKPWKNENNTCNGGITYRIQNIDSSDCDFATTIIKNDINLIPFGFVYYTYDKNLVKTAHPVVVDENYTPQQSDKVYWETSESSQKLNLVNALVKLYVKFPNADEEIYIQRTNKDGDATFSIQIPEHANQKYTIQQLLSSVIGFEYEGNNENKPSTLGVVNQSTINRRAKELTENQKRIQELEALKAKLSQNSRQKTLIQNAINSLNTDNIRNVTNLTYTDSYRRYKPGNTVTININLQSNILSKNNYIVFKPDILHSGNKDEVTVFYKACNLENNQGILNTSFETDTYMLIQNKTEKNIYCGVETNLYAKTHIEKKIIEQNTLNVIHIVLYNEKRDNHDVMCKVDLGPYPLEELLGKYDFTNINIDDGDYNITTLNGRTIIEWNVGEMSADTQTKAVITLKGHSVGLSEILVDTYDYLHNESQTQTIRFGEYQCDCRGE